MKGMRGDVRIWLRHNITSLRSNHDTLAERACCGIVHGLEEAPRNTCGALDAGSVVVILVIIRRAILNPMTLQHHMSIL